MENIERSTSSPWNMRGGIEGQQNLKEYITKFYKDLFGPPEDNHFSLNNRRDDIPQVSQPENEFLMAPFTEKEIREAIFSMEHNKAPGPDGFPVEFYQHFWEVIKGDLINMFHDLHSGDLPLFSLNFGVISLLPKTREANKIQQYRPICLLNVSFKIFTKVATGRINLVADHLISPTQTTFMRGQNILEGVVVLHETIHELHRKNLSGVIFKIDFEKTYDKVKWNFLLQTLRLRGFSPKWIEWIKSFISGGSVAINVNEEIGPYFQTKKGLRQGDLLSPILFNIVVDMLTLLINRAKANDQVHGVVPHLIDSGISILQYADDTILFIDHNLEQAQNMKNILCAFEQISGLKINFHKSEIFCFGEAKNYENHYMELFGCNLSNFPIRYLGIPIHYRKLSNNDWVRIQERFEHVSVVGKGKTFQLEAN